MAKEVQEVSDQLKSMKINEDPRSWNDVLQILPRHEVVRLIFDRLSIKDKISARSVCREWNSFTDETLEFCPLLFDDSVTEVTKFGSKGKYIRTLRISQLKTLEYPTEGLGFSRIRKLQLIPCKIQFGCEHSHIEGISEDNLARLLKDYSDIQILSLHSGALEEIRCPSILQTVQLNCLKKLHISAGMMDGHGFKVSAEILQNTFPSLAAVNFVFINSEDNMIHIPWYYEEAYQFLVRHSNTLDKIALSHSNCVNERELEWFELMIDHLIPEGKYLNLLEGIDNVKVSSLSLELTYYEGRSRFQFGIRLLQAQDTLTCLHITNLAHPNITVWNALPEVLRQCSGTLKNVSIQGCFCPVQGTPEPFSCSYLKECGRLMVLSTDICGLQISDIEDLPKQIKGLNLGQMLTRPQVDFIAKNMINLVDFKLPQGMSGTESAVPKVTAKIFKDVLKLPKLVHLTLRKESSAYQKIHKIILRTSGIEEGVENPGGYIKLTIDRSLFGLRAPEVA